MPSLMDIPQTQYVEDQNLNNLYNDLNTRVGMRFFMDPGAEYHEATRQLENQIKEGGGNPYGYFSQSGSDLSDQEKTRAAQNFNMGNSLMGGGSIGTLGGTGYGEYPLGTAGPRVDAGRGRQLSMTQPRMQQGFATPLPTQSPINSTVFNPVAPPAGSAPSSGNMGVVGGGLALGGLLSNNFGDAMRGAGEYYLGQQGVEGAYQTGVTGLEMSQNLGQQAAQAAQFKPYTVTSNLARVGTDAQGGFTTQLSIEQQAMQNQAMGAAGNLFGQVGQDPAQAQAALYEQMRAVQRPEEERQRLQMQEGLFSSGRGGVQTAMYGGTPEQMAYEKARQESMLGANLAARTQSQAEQAQAANLGGMMQQYGYNPQQQALSLLEASQIPTGLQQKGQLTGAELQSQLGGRGIESYMQGADLANRLQLQQQQGLMSSVMGSQPTLQEQLMNRILNPDGPKLEGNTGLLGGAIEWGKELLGLNPVTRVDGGGVYVNGQGDGYNPAPQSYIDSLNTPIDTTDYNPYV
tara:strand:- start:247 stop:1797 length:1551 start_codon:yes stop_codon:yes gene_type:complete